MSGASQIEWTEMTWNPVTGCTKVSPGCRFCYAERLSHRLKAIGVNGYENGFQLALHPDRLEAPKKRKTPTVWFVNSMSDMFHEKVPFSFVDEVMKTIRQTTSTSTKSLPSDQPEWRDTSLAARYRKMPGWV